MTRIRALVFDAYGTLFDVHSVVDACESIWPGKGSAVSQLWRAKQLEYTWLRSLMGRYADFDTITEAGLAYACAALGLACGADARARLMDAYLRLSPFADVKGALARLTALRLAILSNGSPRMIAPLVANAGLAQLIPDVISVHELRIYKPAPSVYELAVTRLGLPADAIGFVSSNCWDACGARSFGLRTFWINRGAAPVDLLAVAPDHEIRTLEELPELI